MTVYIYPLFVVLAAGCFVILAVLLGAVTAIGILSRFQKENEDIF